MVLQIYIVNTTIYRLFFYKIHESTQNTIYSNHFLLKYKFTSAIYYDYEEKKQISSAKSDTF